MALYRVLTSLLHYFLPFLLRSRLIKEKEDGARIDERYGRSNELIKGAVWVHAASIGELKAVLPLIEMIKSPVLVTTMTKTAADLAANILPSHAFHRYIPFDTPQNAKVFIDNYAPKIAIFVEQELWPNLIYVAFAKNIPLYLINARFSTKTLKLWKRFSWFFTGIFSKFTLILAQNEKDKLSLQDLGAKVEVSGNIKFDYVQPPIDFNEASKFTHNPILLLASTHSGEEEIGIKAHQGEGLLMIAPRHIERRDEIVALVPNIKMRSKGEYPTSNDRFYLIDSYGEMPLFYTISDKVFMGKSLVKGGGQNPIEAISAGALVIHGANVANFQALYDELDLADAAIKIRGVDDLSKAFQDQDETRRERASSIIANHRGAVAKTYAYIFGSDR